MWALPTPGGPDDFGRLLGLVSEMDPERSAPGPVRALWALRWKLGEVFGWDDDEDGLGQRVASLRERLPADLRDGPRGPETPTLPFEPLYRTSDEFAAEIANDTMHGVMHLGWVRDDERGGWRGQMAVLVKPHGRFGDAYMAAIKPFRLFLVYPAMLRSFERAWQRATVAG